MSHQRYIHLACHGAFNWVDPRRSGVRLADGWLTLGHLGGRHMAFSTIRLLVLSACETGMVQIVGASPDEYLGLPSGLIQAGVPCVVASLWEVSDISTALLMVRFHRNHRAHQMTIARSLREAQQWLRRLTPGETLDALEGLEAGYNGAGGPPISGLIELKNHLRHVATHDPDRRPFAQPYYWAPFAVNGV
jgi:CHAT domain-containing protein